MLILELRRWPGGFELLGEASSFTAEKGKVHDSDDGKILHSVVPVATLNSQFEDQEFLRMLKLQRPLTAF